MLDEELTQEPYAARRQGGTMASSFWRACTVDASSVATLRQAMIRIRPAKRTITRKRCTGAGVYQLWPYGIERMSAL